MLDSTFLIVRGILGVIIGVLALMWPGLTIAVLVGIFAIYAFIDGVTNLILGISPPRGYERSWAHVLQGVVGIAAGVLTFMWPGVTALALIFLIAAWAVTTGIFEIVAAIRLRRVIRGEWLLALSGVLSVLFGLLVFAFPAAGALGIAWTLAVYATASGVVLMVLGARLRSHTRFVPA
jgi:uncharacterized membrane protein HdeD (DUF308 family)